MNEASRARRVLGGLTLAAISVITGYISYQHGLYVARWLGNTGLVAYLLPLVPDLMIVGSSMTLMDATAARERRPRMAMAALVAGIGWTVAQNVAAGWHNGPGDMLLSGAVPLAFVATFESLLWRYRRGRGAPQEPGVPAACDHRPPLSLDDAIAAAGAHLPKRRIAEVFEVSRARVDKVLPPAPRPAELAGAGLNGQASDA